MYLTMLFVAFITSLFWLFKFWGKLGIPRKKVFAFVSIVFAVSILGARAAWILESRNIWQNDPHRVLAVLRFFLPWEKVGFAHQWGYRGMVFLGGFLTSVGAGIFLASRWFPWVSRWSLADSVFPVIALDLFFVRMGCHFNGCCFGRECIFPSIGVSFPEQSPAGFIQVLYHWKMLYPTQLFSAFNGIVLFGILLWVLKRYGQTHPGLVTRIFILEYCFFRIFIDYFRYYESSAFWGTMTYNQWICLGGILFALMPWEQQRESASAEAL